MFKKVLILSASAGAGHVRAAEAVEHAFAELKAAEEIRNLDVLQFTNKVFRNLYSKAYIDAVNRAPDLLGWIYDHLDKPWKNEKRRLAFDKLNTRPFVKMLKDYRPEMIVCTHFLPAEIISWLKAKDQLDCPQSVVVTDFDVHAMWLVRNYEQYFVALDETRFHMSKLGIDSERITVTGIPIDTVFSKPRDKQEMRAKHGLKPDRATILLSAGGLGVGPLEPLIKTLLEMHHQTQIIAICGRNEELKTKLETLATQIPADNPVSVKVVGFTREMDELMAASDILLGKPGGLTTSEALARGLVFVIVNPIPGQEERNSDHLLEQGVAIRCNNLPTLAFKIDRLLDDPARFANMQSQPKKMSRPNAAFDIVKKLTENRNRESEKR